jgi:hypothetical protein
MLNDSFKSRSQNDEVKSWDNGMRGFDETAGLIICGDGSLETEGKVQKLVEVAVNVPELGYGRGEVWQIRVLELSRGSLTVTDTPSCVSLLDN